MRLISLLISLTVCYAQESKKTEFSVDKLAKTYASSLEYKDDQRLDRVFVPNEKKPQGELRLIRRGDGLVMQNLLYTKFLKRATGIVRKKEAKAWPKGREGYSDSQLYICALKEVRDYIWEKFKLRENREDRRQKLMVELILDKKASIIIFYEMTIEEKGKEVTVTHRAPIVIVPVSRKYLTREMHLICRDGLKYDMAKAQALFPIASPEKEVFGKEKTAEPKPETPEGN